MKRIVTIAAALLLSTAASSQAAIVTWSAATNVNAASDVSTTGTLLRALELGAGTNRVINGVTFAGYTTVAAGLSGTYNVSTNTGPWGDSLFTGYGVPVANDNSALLADYGTALSTGTYSTGVGVIRTQTLSGLATGHSYLVQAWFNDVRVLATTNSNIFDSGSGTPSVNLQSDDAGLDGAGGRGPLAQYATGTFSADGTGTQIIRWDENSSPSIAGPTINLFQIRDVTPAVMALSTPVNGGTVIRGGNANVGVTIGSTNNYGLTMNYSLAATGGGTLTIGGTPDTGALVPATSAAQTANVTTSNSTPLGTNTVTFTGTSADASNSGQTLGTTITVWDHADAEFVAPSSPDTLDLDFGNIAQNSGTYDLQYQIENLLASFRAGLDLETINEVLDASELYSTDATAFINLTTGSQSTVYDVTFNSNGATLGTHTAQYTFNLSDQDGLSGSIGGQMLTLNVTAVVVPEPSSLVLLLFGGVMLWIVRKK